MDLLDQLTLGFRLFATVIAWGIWWRRRGRTRRALSVAVTVWTIASSAWLLADGSWSGLALLDTAGGVWLVLAMTPRRPEVAALRSSEAKFAAAFRHSLDAVLLTSIPSGEVLEVNRGFTVITGIEREDATGRTTRELELWADLEDRERMMQALREKGRVHELVADFQRPDGEIRHGLLWGELIEVEDRTCLLTVVRDVTETRRQERERAALIAELEGKNEQLERFAYTVAHDLRSPLLSIRGFVELAREDWERGELDDVPDHLLRISGGAERLQDLLDSLLELSRAGKVIEAPRRVALREVAEEAVELLSSAVRGSGAEIVIADDLPEVSADRTRLLQVMQNLVANALAVLGEEPNPRIEIGVRRGDEPGAEPIFFVRDNGRGIAADQLERIFELFERGSSPAEGSGIGLALVRRIVEGHGGRAWAESDGPGHGATFCFTLPTA